jgi:hypothetical protein
VSEILLFTIVAVGLYFGSDALLDWIERRRGARFENRQIVFFGIILALALISFTLLRALGAAG